MSDATLAKPLGRIRAWRRIYWCLLALVAAGLVATLGSAPPSWSVAAPLLIIFVGGAVIQYTDLRLRQLECPRCGQPFFRNQSKVFGVSAEGWAYWARHCANCQLLI